MNKLLRHHKTLIHRRNFKSITRLLIIPHNERIEGILAHILIVLIEKMLVKKRVVNGILGFSLPTGGSTNHAVQSTDAQAVHILTRNILANFRQVRQRECSVARRNSFDLDFLKDI